MIHAQFDALKALIPTAELYHDGGVAGAYIPQLPIATQQGEVQADVILYPHGHSGYQSRLFFERQLQGAKAQNWTTHSLGGRTWWACSRQGVEPSLPWIEILACHLNAVQ